MADASAYAHHPPWGAAFKNPAVNGDDTMEKTPPDQDDLAPGIVSDQSRLGGAAGLPNLKERGT